MGAGRGTGDGAAETERQKKEVLLQPSHVASLAQNDPPAN